MDKINLTTNECSLTDTDYRYQLEKPVIITQKNKGTMVTCIINSNNISKYLNINEMFFGKYISYKLSCSINKNKEYNCICLGGEFTDKVITDFLIEFINIYILCPVCDLPETNLLLNKKKGICHNCRSCGNVTKVNITNIDKTYLYIEKELEKK